MSDLRRAVDALAHNWCEKARYTGDSEMAGKLREHAAQLRALLAVHPPEREEPFCTCGSAKGCDLSCPACYPFPREEYFASYPTGGLSNLPAPPVKHYWCPRCGHVSEKLLCEWKGDLGHLRRDPGGWPHWCGPVVEEEE